MSPLRIVVMDPPLQAYIVPVSGMLCKQGPRLSEVMTMCGPTYAYLLQRVICRTSHTVTSICAEPPSQQKLIEVGRLMVVWHLA